jgi:hypothetical protein
MSDEPGVIKLEVLVYPDGGTQVSVPPVDDRRRAPILESAAVALRRAADRASRELDPVTCSQCGEVARGAKVLASGAAQLLPCGHTTS